MSRSILAGAALVAAAAFVPHVPAMAQNNAGIVVTAPAIRNADESRLGAKPRMRLASTIRVYTGDLDLRTAYGRAVLDARVKLAADAACDRLDQIDPPTGVGAALNPDVADCRHLAAKSALPQMRVAIAASG
jgi:UrcA family protein